MLNNVFNEHVPHVSRLPWASVISMITWYHAGTDLQASSPPKKNTQKKHTTTTNKQTNPLNSIILDGLACSCS